MAYEGQDMACVERPSLTMQINDELNLKINELDNLIERLRGVTARVFGGPSEPVNLEAKRLPQTAAPVGIGLPETVRLIEDIGQKIDAVRGQVTRLEEL